MFIILFSPFIALLCDQVIRRNQIASKWTILLILLLVIPASVLWVSDYGFANKNFSFVVTTLFLSGIQLVLFKVTNVRHSVKLVAAFVFALMLCFITLAGAFLAEWGGGSPSILNEVEYDNYKAIILEPQLYSSSRVLRVKKTALSGMVQKNIFEKDLPDSAVGGNCIITIHDESNVLVFDFCNNKFRLIN